MLRKSLQDHVFHIGSYERLRNFAVGRLDHFEPFPIVNQILLNPRQNPRWRRFLKTPSQKECQVSEIAEFERLPPLLVGQSFKDLHIWLVEL
jgi:hypothetical protein